MTNDDVSASWGELVRQHVLTTLTAQQTAFEARCFRLGRDHGVVCARCDEPAVCVLDRYQSGESLDWEAIVTDHRTPVCLSHAPAGTAELLASERT